MISKIDWYNNLLTDLKKLEFTGIVLTKHAIGKRLLQDELKFKKPEYGSKRMENLAKDLNTESRELYRCVQFAKKCHAVTELQKLSWRQIVNDYLPETTRVTENKIETPKLPTGKYNIIYADPAWKYEFCSDDADQIEQHYDTMELEDIKNLKVPSAENAILYLWATAPKLQEAIEVLNAWGFTYRTCAVWDKQHIGMGYWFRGQHELLLVGVKGEFNAPEPTKRVSSVYSEKRTKHSKKPDYYYKLIEQMFPDGKYLELFARNKFNDKWTVWGNEINE